MTGLRVPRRRPAAVSMSAPCSTERRALGRERGGGPVLGEGVPAAVSPHRHEGDGAMSAAMAMPGNTAATFLTHFFGPGLADDDRYRAFLTSARHDGTERTAHRFSRRSGRESHYGGLATRSRRSVRGPMRPIRRLARGNSRTPDRLCRRRSRAARRIPAVNGLWVGGQAGPARAGGARRAASTWANSDWSG